MMARTGVKGDDFHEISSQLICSVALSAPALSKGLALLILLAWLPKPVLLVSGYSLGFLFHHSLCNDNVIFKRCMKLNVASN